MLETDDPYAYPGPYWLTEIPGKYQWAL